MKCGKCGNNEAVLHYKSMVNGEITELHLCPECAAGEEFAGMFDVSGGMEEFFSGGFMRPFANRGGVFAPAIGFAPVIFAPVKTSESVPEVPAEASEQKIPKEADPLIVQRRELHALKFELNKAVKAEEYEKAAELRDKIRVLEGSGG